MKVSVVVPVYNAGALLARTLDSILAQTFRDFEVVCIDDGSTDGSRDVLKAYAEKDARIRLIFQKNAGGVVARNRGLEESTGEAVYFCDHDDRLHPNLLEFCVREIEQNHVDGVFFGAKTVTDPNDLDMVPFETIKKNLKKVRTESLCEYLEFKDGLQIQLPPWAYFVKRGLLTQVGSTSSKNARFDYLVKFFTSFRSAVVTNAPLYYYTAFNTSMSRQAVRLSVISDFHTTLVEAADYFLKVRGQLTRAAQKAILKQIFIKNLKYQWNWIRRSRKKVPVEEHRLSQDEFRKELRDLRARGCLPFHYIHLKQALAYLRFLIVGK